MFYCFIIERKEADNRNEQNTSLKHETIPLDKIKLMKDIKLLRSIWYD